MRVAQEYRALRVVGIGPYATGKKHLPAGKCQGFEIDLLVEKMKLSFGMDVTKYNIEPKKKIV